MGVCHVLLVAGKELEVLDPIIRRVPVDVMDDLARREVTPQVLGHHLPIAGDPSPALKGHIPPLLTRVVKGVRPGSRLALRWHRLEVATQILTSMALHLLTTSARA